MSARRGSATGFRVGSTNRRGSGQEAPQLRAAYGVKLFAQGLQLGGEQTGYRDVPALSAEQCQVYRSGSAREQVFELLPNQFLSSCEKTVKSFQLPKLGIFRNEMLF
jgi:hypothetical protein